MDLSLVSKDELLAELNRREREPRLPVSYVCQSIFTWLDAIHAEHIEVPEVSKRDFNLHMIAKAWGEIGSTVRLQSSKSALLCRLLYAQGELRTEKCPKHNGHWHGCGGDCLCVDECGNNTGWLPNE